MILMFKKSIDYFKQQDFSELDEFCLKSVFTSETNIIHVCQLQVELAFVCRLLQSRCVTRISCVRSILARFGSARKSVKYKVKSRLYLYFSILNFSIFYGGDCPASVQGYISC